MQSVTCPKTTFHVGLRALVCDLERFKPRHERGDNFASLGRENRHRDYFINSLVGKIAAFAEITELLLTGQLFQRQLSFGFSAQRSQIFRTGRRKNSAVAVEKTTK